MTVNGYLAIFFEKLTVNACCTGRVMNMNEERERAKKRLHKESTGTTRKQLQTVYLLLHNNGLIPPADLNLSIICSIQRICHTTSFKCFSHHCVSRFACFFVPPVKISECLIQPFGIQLPPVGCRHVQLVQPLPKIY